MSPPRRRYDERDVRIRPSRRGSRPRTKERPAHHDAVTGRVLGVDRGRYAVLVDERTVTAMKARGLGRRSVVVGDAVDLVGDVSATPGSLARIVRLLPRRTVLRRSADDTDTAERIIVANADQLAIVTAVTNPPPRTRMIDRCLVAAYDAGLDPLLVLTKADLQDPDAVLADYATLQVPQVVTSFAPCTGTVTGLAELERHLGDRVTVLVGHSGVGKSTLVNALVPGADRAIGAVNQVTGRGRHTSSSAVALPLPGRSGWIVDTPGVRSFGLAHVATDRIITHFPELAPAVAACPRGCSHDEPGCALDDWVADGDAGSTGPARLDSLRRLLRTRSEADQD